MAFSRTPPSGKKRSRRQRKIRMTRRSDRPFAQMTRRQAIEAIMLRLEKHAMDPFAMELIELFNIDGEELCEAGLPFETVKALEARCLTLRHFN